MVLLVSEKQHPEAQTISAAAFPTMNMNMNMNMDMNMGMGMGMDRVGNGRHAAALAGLDACSETQVDGGRRHPR